jgi:hypothetical protein
MRRIVDQFEVVRLIRQHVIRQVGDDRGDLHIDRSRLDEPGHRERR